MVTHQPEAFLPTTLVGLIRINRVAAVEKRCVQPRSQRQRITRHLFDLLDLCVVVTGRNLWIQLDLLVVFEQARDLESHTTWLLFLLLPNHFAASGSVTLNPEYFIPFYFNFLTV